MFLESLGSFGVDYANGTYDKEMADSFPASDPPSGDGVVDSDPVPVATIAPSRTRVEVAAPTMRSSTARSSSPRSRRARTRRTHR
jgi:hypothetical protein